MSGSHLPDDVAAWPRDVHAILGVEPSADSRSIKRPYTRLLRFYKPEHAPQQFQKLRAAYETAFERAQWRERYLSHEAEEEAVEASSDEAADVPKDSPQQDDPGPPPASFTRIDRPRAPLPDAVAAAWQAALAGRTAEAYQQLVQWHERECDAIAPALRWRGYAELYWLLVLEPALASDVAATDWLRVGIEQSPGASPLIELWERELIRDDREAFRPEVQAWLASLPVETLAEVLPLFWQARARQGEHERMLEELAAYRPRFEFAAPDEWLKLCAAAVEHCLFALPMDHARFAAALKELMQADHGGPVSWRIDRLDHLLVVRQQWTEMESDRLPRAWLALLAATFDRRPEQEAILDQIVAEIVLRPLQAVSDLDRFCHDYPASASLFCTQLEGYCEQSVDRTVETDVADVVLPGRLERSIGQFTNYAWVRNDLLKWSLLEFIPPAALPTLIERITGISFAEEIDADRSFHLVANTWAAYWSVSATGS